MARVPVSKTGGWGFESLLPCECDPANPPEKTRQAGRRIGEDMATQTRGEAPEKRSGAGRAAKRETRTTPALFFRQMVGELRKVIWPTRSMLVTYTVVCMVFVIFMVIVVTTLDYGFTKLVFALFG